MCHVLLVFRCSRADKFKKWFKMITLSDLENGYGPGASEIGSIPMAQPGHPLTGSHLHNLGSFSSQWDWVIRPVVR